MAVNVMLLAGAANTGPLREVSPVTNEALVEINGRPMVQYVIDALEQAKEVRRIVVVSPPGELEPYLKGRNLEFVPSRNHIVDNVVEAAKVLPPDEEFLIVSCDVPLITGQMIDDLVALCRRTPGELYYPIIEKGVAETSFPHTKRTYVTLREGVYTGGNIFLCHPSIVERAAPRVRAFLDYRKSPLKMLGVIGWTFAIRYMLLKNLTLKELEAKVSEMLDVKGVVVVCPWPEVGVDVDKPSDLELVRSILE